MYNNVVLFDGVCSLCNASVDFIIRHEKGDKLTFASLQSDVGKAILEKSGVEVIPDSILLYNDGKLLVESTAVLCIARFLKRPYSWLNFLSIVPMNIRDTVYRLVARNRYKWFGKRDTCRIPTPQERDKLLG
ncbi:DCC1-like thiol-disulfide oxidoreductase family protein [Bacteroidia bacterium]|nr:DCC1-like thiol-disulfide oxidoreductase family protein [Bacteroidia bacterium]MDB4173180.1 DCC1-like thiol-disulfide oxidoreductase family protein [Bacteroidia bacterium]